MRTVGAMPATAFAAVAPQSVRSCGDDHEAGDWVEIGFAPVSHGLTMRGHDLRKLRIGWI